jgi:hypothetical protein
MGRKEQDVFVLGDETLVAEPDRTQDANLAGDYDVTREFGAESAELHEPVTPATARSRVALAPRRLAVLGLSAGAATVVAISVLSAGGGDGGEPSSPPNSTSLVTSPPPLPAVTHETVAPSPRPRSKPHRQRRVTQSKREVRNQRRQESERENTPNEAPVDSTVSIPTTTAPAPVAPSPTPATTPEPPSSPPPPPPVSGGSSGARAEFTFER